jgi:hypothetical protein
VGYVNSKAILVRFPIGKQSGKLIKSDMVPFVLRYPMHCPHIFYLLNEQSDIELSYDLYVLIIVETHKLLYVMALKSSDNLIENWVVLLGHMAPIYSLSFGHYPSP